MSNAGYRFQSGTCACTISDGRAEGQSFDLVSLSSRSAEIDTQIQFQPNEYIDIAIARDGDDLPLFAHVIESQPGRLWVRWLHFDPGEQEQLAKRLVGWFGPTTDELPDANPPAPGSERTRKKRSERRPAVSGKRDGTRRVVKPKAPAERSNIVPEDAESARHDASASRNTRRVTRPSQRAKAMPTAPSTDESSAAAEDDFADIFGGVPEDEAPTPAPPAGREGRPRTATVEPFADGGSGSGTRRVVLPRKTKPADDDHAPTPAHAADGDDPSGKHVVIAPTARFEQLPSQPKGAKKVDGKPETMSVRKNVLNKDGKLDVAASVRSKAKTVRASELAARHDKVRVLNMSTIKELIQDAVQEAVTRLGGSLDESERKRLLQEAEADFQERLKAFKAEKAGAEAQAKNLQDQLKRAESLLQEERKKSVEADQFTVSEAGMEDLEKRMERLVSRAIKVNGVNETLANELQGMVVSLLDSERERIAEQAADAQSQAIAMLEKKVQRLASTLDEVESERDQHRRRAMALEAAGGGVSGFMTSELGEDPDKERKLELLKDIFDQNQEMRESLKERGIEVTSRRRPVVPAAPAEASSGPGDDQPTTAPEAVQADALEPSDNPAEAPASDEATEAPVDDAEAGQYDDLGDPDDEVWEPGMSFSREVAGDNEDPDADDTAVKKLTGVKQFAPPPLQRKAAAEEAESTFSEASDAPPAETAESGAAEEAADDILDPDDMPWEPGMSFSQEVAGDNEAADDDDNAVKKLTDFKSFEPPPLNRD